MKLSQLALAEETSFHFSCVRWWTLSSTTSAGRRSFTLVESLGGGPWANGKS